MNENTLPLDGQEDYSDYDIPFYNDMELLNEPSEEELQSQNEFCAEQNEDAYVRHMDGMMAELGCNWDDPRLLEA
jgi:hypothetical protein